MLHDQLRTCCTASCAAGFTTWSACAARRPTSGRSSGSVSSQRAALAPRTRTFRHLRRAGATDLVGRSKESAGRRNRLTLHPGDSKASTDWNQGLCLEERLPKEAKAGGFRPTKEFQQPARKQIKHEARRGGRRDVRCRWKRPHLISPINPRSSLLKRNGKKLSKG